jgi:toxin FitB
VNIIDSSAWLEYFSDGQNADNFSSAIEDETSLIIPVITIYEVFKVVLRESTENKALQVIAAMQKGKIIDLTPGLAMEASKLSLNYNLPMADSIILATARRFDCTIWTQDSDFQDLEGVKFFPKT